MLQILNKHFGELTSPRFDWTASWFVGELSCYPRHIVHCLVVSLGLVLVLEIAVQ